MWRFSGRWPLRCGVDGCGATAWRLCLVCDVRVCRDHRIGAGNFFRCARCPSAALAAVREELQRVHDAARAARRAHAERARVVLRCLVCGALMSPRAFRRWPGVTFWSPACACR